VAFQDTILSVASAADIRFCNRMVVSASGLGR